MKEYAALWHIGDVTRGEIIMLSDEDAEKLLKKGAIKPVGRAEKPTKAEEPKQEPEKEPEKPADADNPEEGAEIEDGDGTEVEDDSETDEEPEAPEIDALDGIVDEPKQEPAKPGKRGNRKKGA